MVMTTDIPSGAKMEQAQVKSDVPFAGNKAPTTSTSAKSERQFTRVLRSKSSSTLKNENCGGNIENEEVQLVVREPFSHSPEPGIVEENSNHKTDSSQVTHLRQLLLLHLDLIQQQQEELQRKDREINQLKLDKEQLESRMHRLERRMAVKKRRDIKEGYDQVFEENDATKPATPKSRRLSVEQMVRAKRVPATASVTMTSHMCEDISFDTHMRTEMLYFHGDLHDLCKNTVVKQLENKGQEHVQVPTWQINEIPTASVKPSSSKSLKTPVSFHENVECIDDDVFVKRHMKHELEEKRRKRWDLQHMRAMQAHQNLEKKCRDREEARLKGKKLEYKDNAKCMQSFLPAPEDVMAVEVSDTVPVVAFGYPVPLFHNREFEVPWFSLDKRELIERKGKVRPGRSRGKPRGRPKGIS